VRTSRYQPCRPTTKSRSARHPKRTRKNPAPPRRNRGQLSRRRTLRALLPAATTTTTTTTEDARHRHWLILSSSPSDFDNAGQGDLELLVAKLCPDFVPDSLKDPYILKQRLHEVLFSNLETIGWFTDVLFGALLSGDLNQCALVARPNGDDAYPLIILLSEWKQLRKLHGYRGGDDFIEIAIKLGADVNARFPGNGINALFFAVKYASIHGVNLLIDAGIDVQAKDIGGRTCLYNTLEYPDPQILTRLLEFLPVTETFLTYENPGGVGAIKKFTAADQLLNFFTPGSFDLATNQRNGNMPVSWMLMGRPSAENLAQAFVIVLRKGATFTPEYVGLLNALFGVHTLPPNGIGYENFLAFFPRGR